MKAAAIIFSQIIAARTALQWTHPDPYLRTVGILTMPPAESEAQEVGHGHYVTEMADIFMRMGGLYPVYIPYNVSDTDLYPLLDQINGVYFTGGDLDLYDETTGKLHPYTITSQKILDYAIKVNDLGDYFPIMGTCQGLELLHILVANDTKALGWSTLINEHVSTKFLDNDPQRNSKLFKQFDKNTLQAMKDTNILWHYHHRSVPVQFYLKFPKLDEFFKIVTVNEIDGTFIAASVEARKYPIFLTQYHPEVVLDPASDINSVRSPLNMKVAFHFANFFAEECQKSTHKFKNYSSLTQKGVKNGYRTRIQFVDEYVNAWSFDY